MEQRARDKVLANRAANEAERAVKEVERAAALA
jgi:hypothetical protein